MTILIACDKFKSSIDAIKAGEAIGEGLLDKYPKAKILYHPMSDGGDGSLSIIRNHLKGKDVQVSTQDAIARNIKCAYFLVEKTAYIELATASGIAQIEKAFQNPMNTSTFGTGLMIKDALEKGASKIVLLLGGSCSNDAGLGIAEALGFQYYDEKNRKVTGIGKNLLIIKKIIAPKNLPSFALELLCDVDNPLYGPNGAAYVYARQKGADDLAIKILDQGLRNISDVIGNYFQNSIADIPGGGAAGGIAAGLHGLLNGSIKNGFEFIAETTGLKEKIRKADVVISGEGKLDQQSLRGKVIGEMAKLCSSMNKKMIAIVGKNELTKAAIQKANIHQVLEIINITNEVDGMKNAGKYLRELGAGLKWSQ